MSPLVIASPHGKKTRWRMAPKPGHHPDRYPLPNMQDLANHLHGATIFSKLDLVKGYHQVPVREEDKAKTAFITPFVLFEYNLMHFGLSNVGKTFQCLIDQNFRDLLFCFPFADDNLVGSKERNQHLQHLRQVFHISRSAAWG